MHRMFETKTEGGRIKSFAIAALLFLLSGCAGQQAQPKTPEQVDARGRAVIHAELGANYYSRGQYGVAIAELNEAIGSDPSYGASYNILGLVHMELHEDDLAVQNFEKALNLNPNDSDAHNNYGWFLCQRNRVNESIKHFISAVKNPLYQTPEKSYLNAGLCLAKNKDMAGAEDFFIKVIKRQPQNAQALYELANISYSRGQYIEAKAYLSQFSQDLQESAESLWLSLRVARKLGDRNAESSYGLQLRRKFPSSPQAQALMSGHYE